MATRKQKEKNKDKGSEDGTNREVPLRQSPRKRAGSSGSSQAKPIMNSLDMLAQVAAKLQEPGNSDDGGSKSSPSKKETHATPQKAAAKEQPKEDPKKNLDDSVMSEDNSPSTSSSKTPAKSTPKTPKKVTKRSIQSMEEVTLSQIQSLSSKAMISLFSEMTANEMTRNYTYTCFLMPEKCQETISSFGNETKARSAMINHLLAHISLLVEKANDPEGSEGEFVAIPLTVRRKKEAEAAKRRKRGIAPGAEPAAKRRRTTKSKFTAIKTTKSEGDVEEQDDEQQAVDSVAEPPASPSGSESSKKSDKKGTESDRPKKKAKRPSAKQTAQSSSADEGSSQQNGRVSPTGSTGSSGKSAGKKSGKSVQPKAKAESQEPSSQQTEDQEQVIIETMSRMQPFHDHSYTTVFGKRHNWDDSGASQSSSGEEDGEEEEDDDASDSASCASSQSDSQKKSVPILPLSHISGGDGDVPMVSSEEIIPRRGRPGSSGTATESGPGHSGEKPYPPMPKSALATQGRLVVPEEEGSASEAEESSAAVTPKKRKRLSKGNRESHSEWEKRIALKCIREIRGRKKDDKLDLVCKICRIKTFTAGATLMYHYRSHAGIKPFVCVICNTTFTRQHSLNYHMLIHNNQSRFSCKDCGRKFRHPSHFKEHLRRHTGETPFECTECQNRFKTRNTYKRHLKTRHGKLLTVFGIHPMSKEEFMKVRTKPYKKLPTENAPTAEPQPSTSYQPAMSTPTQPHSHLGRPRKIRPDQNTSTPVNTAVVAGAATSDAPSQPLPALSAAPTVPVASQRISMPSATMTSADARTIVTAQPAPFITFTANPQAPGQHASVPAHTIALATPINAPTITMASPAATYFLPPIAFTTAGTGLVSMHVGATPQGQGEEKGEHMYMPVGIVER